MEVRLRKERYYSISMFLPHIVRAVRSKKCVDCANWDKSVKLGTETHYRLYVKNFKGDTPRKSRDC